MNNQNTNVASRETKFCSNCGAEIDAKAVVCPKCGVPVSGASIANVNDEPNPSAWWGVLGFLFPVIGWILYFAFKSNTPKRAHRCAVSAWWGFGISFVIGLLAGMAGA
ncbi:zinc-ribbon domain-containing protein [Limosilactobacillus sp.]|uniref:zinc-ribbon domain-containing protein n=1 Tax=Limosilactobacillus sp. TaxID=2773925 RepID=UPI003EFF3036